MIWVQLERGCHIGAVTHQPLQQKYLLVYLRAMLLNFRAAGGHMPHWLWVRRPSCLWWEPHRFPRTLHCCVGSTNLLPPPSLLHKTHPLNTTCTQYNHCCMGSFSSQLLLPLPIIVATQVAQAPLPCSLLDPLLFC